MLCLYPTLCFLWHEPGSQKLEKSLFNFISWGNKSMLVASSISEFIIQAECHASACIFRDTYNTCSSSEAILLQVWLDYTKKQHFPLLIPYSPTPVGPKTSSPASSHVLVYLHCCEVHREWPRALQFSLVHSHHISWICFYCSSFRGSLLLPSFFLWWLWRSKSSVEEVMLGKVTDV